MYEYGTPEQKRCLEWSVTYRDVLCKKYDIPRWWSASYGEADFYGAFRAMSAALFEADTMVVKVSETFTKIHSEMTASRYFWHDGEGLFSSLTLALAEVLGEHAAPFVTEGTSALFKERPVFHYNRKPYDRDKTRRGRKPQAWQSRVDEAQDWHRGHRCSKSWKDQSKKRHQWE